MGGSWRAQEPLGAGVAKALFVELSLGPLRLRLQLGEVPRSFGGGEGTGRGSQSPISVRGSGVGYGQWRPGVDRS